MWPYAIDHATYLYNRTPHSGNPENASPYEMVFGHIPDISHLRPFGTKVWIDPKRKRGKLENNAEEGIYLGHPKNSEGYLVLTDEGIVHTSRYVKFASTFSDYDYSNKNTQDYLINTALLALEPKASDLIKDPINGDSWMTAINDELQSHIDKNTFTLIDAPDPSIKTVDSKLVFKSKLGPNNEIIKHKARMVIRGFTQ